MSFKWSEYTNSIDAIIEWCRIAEVRACSMEAKIVSFRAALVDCNPCRSCGSDPSIDHASGAELPIIAAALDAQAEAETECFRLQNENASLRAELLATRAPKQDLEVIE